MLIDEGLELLDEEECLRLVDTAAVGRVATTVAALPVVLPVNFVVLDGNVVFRTAEGTKLSAAVRNAVVAFEVDEIDRDHRQGWSVLLIGTARHVTEADEVDRAAAALPSTWADGRREHFVTIEPELVSGRRIAAKRNGHRAPAPGA